MGETAWFNEPPPATLFWTTPDLGHLHFYDPNGDRAVVHVTRAMNHKTEHMHVWHIEEDGETATVSPSIHYVDKWHTPNPVVFKLVSELEDPRR